MELTIHVPMVPASCLLPNAQRRTYYKSWAQEAAELRRATKLYALLDQIEQLPPIFTEPVRIYAVIAWPKGRKTCDFQAAVHGLKAAVDGLEDAGVIENDKQVIGMDVVQKRAEKDDMAGWIELTVGGA